MALALTASGGGAGPQLLRTTVPSLDEEKAKQDPSYYLKNTNTETRETLQELYREFKGDEVLAATMRAPVKAKADKLNAVSGARCPALAALLERGAGWGAAGSLRGSSPQSSLRCAQARPCGAGHPEPE